MSVITIEKSDKFFIVRIPWGTSFYMPYCDIDTWNTANKLLSIGNVDYAFMSEGGGFVVKGNPIADALVNYQL